MRVAALELLKNAFNIIATCIYVEELFRYKIFSAELETAGVLIKRHILGPNINYHTAPHSFPNQGKGSKYQTLLLVSVSPQGFHKGMPRNSTAHVKLPCVTGSEKTTLVTLTVLP